MYKFFTFFYAVFFLLCSISCSSGSNNKETLYTVERGVYDISNLGASEIIDLNGEWVFIPNKLADPQKDFSGYDRYELINQSWTEYKEPMPAFGYATYSIQINNFLEDAVYAIKIAEVSSALTAYINGKEFFKAGKVGISKEDEIFDWNSNVVILPLKDKKEARIVFHVSNFSDTRPGFHTSLKIGFYSTLLKENSKDIAFVTITAGILLVLSVFFISLYIFYSKDKKSLYFGLICLIFSLRTFCYEDFLLTTIIPQIRQISMHKLGYVTLSLAIIFVSLFINEIFEKINNKILYIILIPSLIYICINIFTPISVSMSILFYAQIHLIAVAICNLYILIAAAIAKNKTALLFLFALFLFLCLIARDILISNGVIEGAFMSQFGVLLLLIPMMIIVLNHFKFTFDNIADITNKIEIVNNSLVKFLPNEFMEILQKQHTEVCLGDNNLNEMYIAFIYIGIHQDLKSKEKRLSLLEIYNHLLAEINPIIKKYGGFIDKYLTEGLMLLFSSSANDVIKCLLEIEYFIKKENIGRNIEGLPKINFACGVHYGQVMLGTIGEIERMDNTVISDVVNVASRLHFFAMESEGGIFISSAVKNKIILADLQNIIFKDSGDIKLRGRNESVTVYEVVKNV